MDIERYQNLHTIVMLREVLRKWWKAELTFADKTGAVQEWGRGQIVSPQQVCEPVLRNGPSTLAQQDLEQLPGLHAAKVARAQARATGVDLESAEHPRPHPRATVARQGFSKGRAASTGA